ncbi:aryl-alcohol oxidase-like protein [Mycena rosella]|uniref:Aryl-alcohol oxidase-like protein n=1 Tax=Mycena rosella TaxID=1033263 RepID=A0AAD7D8C5_MYCRO|nr:aryl-alcohol oxidase-like protein [Mycena rosella]
MFSPASTILGVLFFGGVGLCKLYEDVADLPRLQYDYVVVGGGTAGNVVANRLTENPDVSVLVLEAGVSNEGVLISEVPFLGNDFFASINPYSWNYTTTPQTGLNGRAISYARAYLLGGCSSHNGMVYTRGAQDDFDRYANLTGDEGWSWNQIFPYFLKNEKWTPPADQHDTHGQFNPGIHGTAGPISVSLSGFQWPDFQRRIIQTTEELPDDFPFNLDMNSGQPLGVGWVQSTIGHGERSSSATGYLAPDFIQRPNLDVLLHAQVSKLVNVTQHQGKPSFGGVQFRSGASLFVAEASKEIILSAGSIGTPQILLNSGVGDHNALHALGIPTVLDLPSVGQNASDHSYFGLTWAVNSDDTIESITQNATRFNEASEQWNTSRTGPFVFPQTGTHAGWLRLSQDSPAFDVHADPSPGPGAPHFELLLLPSGQDLPGNFVTALLAMVSPVSRGSVTVSSDDPFADPLIDPGYLASEFDAIALREGVKLAQKFFNASAWHGYLGAPTINLAAMNATEQMATLRANVASGSHTVGTASMSPRDATYGVVNPDLTVKGIAGLRVIDASVLPIVPGAHTQAATYVVAERGADLVKQLWT